MSSDKHFNEPGVMPELLRDRKGTDMSATRVMFIVIAVMAAIAMVVYVIISFVG